MMENMRIGTSDMVVAPMGVGTMSWSNSRLWGYGAKVSYEGGRAAFDASIAAGLTLFDTAEIYGNGHSEKVLGGFISDTLKPVYVATKYAPLPWRITRGSLRRALKSSLKRLGLKSVDLYQIHFPGGMLKVETLIEASGGLVEEGLTRYVGVSNFSAEKMKLAHKILDKRGIKLVSNQVEYSLIHRSPEIDGVLDACRELNITLIAYSPLGRREI